MVSIMVGTTSVIVTPGAVNVQVGSATLAVTPGAIAMHAPTISLVADGKVTIVGSVVTIN
jgi:hypothetical protein